MGDLESQVEVSLAYVQVSWILDFAKFNIADVGQRKSLVYTTFSSLQPLTHRSLLHFNETMNGSMSKVM